MDAPDAGKKRAEKPARLPNARPLACKAKGRKTRICKSGTWKSSTSFGSLASEWPKHAASALLEFHVKGKNEPNAACGSFAFPYSQKPIAPPSPFGAGAKQGMLKGERMAQCFP
jgi:hypothetical protein